MVGVVQTGIATNNVAGIRPIPAYKEIVIALSVFVSCLINIKHIDHKRDDRIINNDPISIEISGLNTIKVPMKPIIKALNLLSRIFSFKNNIDNIVAKIGTVKPSAVASANAVLLNP